MAGRVRAQPQSDNRLRAWRTKLAEREATHRLNLLQGVLSRHIHFRDASGRRFVLDIKRLVHMEDEHFAAIEWVLTPADWSGVIEVCSAIDGRVSNSGVARYRELEGSHLRVLRWILDVLPSASRPFVVYIGDDETDEDAFAALAGAGAGVRVGGAITTSLAHYRAESPESVGTLLEALSERHEP